MEGPTDVRIRSIPTTKKSFIGSNRKEKQQKVQAMTRMIQSFSSRVRKELELYFSRQDLMRTKGESFLDRFRLYINSRNLALSMGIFVPRPIDAHIEEYLAHINNVYGDEEISQHHMKKVLQYEEFQSLRTSVLYDARILRAYKLEFYLLMYEEMLTVFSLHCSELRGFLIPNEVVETDKEEELPKAKRKCSLEQKKKRVIGYKWRCCKQWDNVYVVVGDDDDALKKETNSFLFNHDDIFSVDSLMVLEDFEHRLVSVSIFVDQRELALRVVMDSVLVHIMVEMAHPWFRSRKTQ